MVKRRGAGVMVVVVEVAIALKMRLLGLREYLAYITVTHELLKYREQKGVMEMA